MSTTLIINPGSSSRKYALYRDGQSVLQLSFEGTATGFEMCSQQKGSQQICESISEIGFDSSFARVAKVVGQYLKEQNESLLKIGIRIVAPGSQFQKHAIIDDVYLSLLQSKQASAPLHIPAVMSELHAAKEYFPETTIIGVSDSAFHTTLPNYAREYSLLRADAEAYDIHRFGCHGLSVESVVHRVHSLIGKDPGRMIVCHVGGGVSVTAVKDGKSLDTSIGYAPVSGVPMSTRAADLDPSALLELMHIRNMTTAQASEYVHESGGLAGLAGDGDIRRLLDRRAHGDIHAKNALDLFTYRIQKEIASATVSLGGLDTLVFTGTASVRSAELRVMLTNRLSHFGIGIDLDRNDVLVGKEGVISVQRSMAKVVIMRTGEMDEMERITSNFKDKS